MICIQHFNQAYGLYLAKKISFRLLQDQAAVMIGLCDDLHAGVASALEVTETHIQWLKQRQEANWEYNEYLGGEVFICESEEDLQHVVGCDLEWAEEHGNLWPNVMEKPLVWDSCDYLIESSGDPQWVMFLICWNNAGGPVYYVPKPLWAAAKVEEHIALTHQMWQA